MKFLVITFMNDHSSFPVSGSLTARHLLPAREVFKRTGKSKRGKFEKGYRRWQGRDLCGGCVDSLGVVDRFDEDIEHDSSKDKRGREDERGQYRTTCQERMMSVWECSVTNDNRQWTTHSSSHSETVV